METAFRLPAIARRPLSALAGGTARRFADEVLGFDEVVRKNGIVAGGRYVLDHFAGPVTFSGPPPPKEGPLLIVSNHPGMVDALAVWAGLGREDLRTVAAARDFLNFVPNTKPHLIFVCPGDSRGLRDALGHLKGGGALLTFPAGRIEPDPAHAADEAVESLADWSPNVATLASRVPGARVLPVAVSGVISARARASFLARRLKTRAERDWAAATLQIAYRPFRPVPVQVRFGEAIDAGDPDLVACIQATMTELIATNR